MCFELIEMSSIHQPADVNFILLFASLVDFKVSPFWKLLSNIAPDQVQFSASRDTKGGAAECQVLHRIFCSDVWVLGHKKHIYIYS